MTARLHYWYLTHPRWGRPALVVAVVQGLSMVAVSAAPAASASTNAMALNWTGLRDSYGVPIGNYYLAIASVRDQLTRAGPDVGWNPETWMRWSVHALEVFATNLTAANILTAEAGLFIGTVALALWVMKITVSTYWLSVIGEIARAVTGAVLAVTTQLGLLALAVPIGVFAGVVTVKRGEVGRGWTMIGLALSMPALSVAVFANPAALMYGPDGLLAFGRSVGFSVAAAATHNGAIGGAAGAGQVDSLTASLITHTVREPLQLWNFGHVVDRVGGCGAAWSAAVSRGAPDGPIQAMAACGDRAAVAYALHLDGTNIWVGLIFVAAAALLGLFMVVSGWAVLRVSVKAIWTTVILLPTLWLGAIPGAPQRRAAEVVWQFFRHGIEVLVYIVYVSVIGLAVERIVSRPLPAELGGTNPFAHVLMMGGVSVAAFLLLRHIRADLSGRPPGRGMLGRAAGVAVGMGMHAAIGGAGSAAGQGARGPGGRSGGGLTPWEQLDAEANNAGRVHGDPQPGFDPVPDGGSGGRGAGPGGAGDGPGGGGGAAPGPGDSRPGSVPGGPVLWPAAPAGVTPSQEHGGGRRDAGPSRAGRGRRAPAAAQSRLDGPAPGAAAVTRDGPAAAAGEEAPLIPPITDHAEPAHPDPAPLSPPPPEDEPPPPDDDGGGPAPPPPTTVDPITET